MARNELSVRAWQKNFMAGMYESKDFETQCAAGWYDWFCKDTSLANKTKTIGNIIKKIQDGGKINLDTMYVWFKNNCPMSGGLYDDFRFADMETGNTLYTISINTPYHEERFAVYCEGHWDEPVFKAATSRELVAWLNTK